MPYIALPPIALYALAFIAGSAVFILLALRVCAGEIPRRIVLALLAAAAVIRLLLIPLDPVGSDDLERYIWDGKVQVHGINPYRHAPSDTALAHLHSDRLPAAVNHPHMTSVYFPLTQWAFALCYMISAEEVWAYKALMVAAEAVLVWILWGAAGTFGLSRRFILLYALSPLAILSFSLDGHIDALGLPMLAGGIVLYLSGRKVPGLLLLGLSLCVKPVALVLLPVLFFAEKDAGARLRAVFLPLAPFVLQFLPYISGPNPFESLFVYTRDWTFNGVVFEAVNAILQHNQQSRIVCALVLLAGVLAISISRRELPVKVYYAVLFLLLLSPVVHPWYVVWLAALLPLVPRWSGILFAATVSLTVLTVIEYQVSGVWRQEWWVMGVEYLPVIGMMGGEILRKRRNGA